MFPAWTVISRRPVPHSQLDRALDKALMRLLAQTFPNHLNHIHEGLAPIHLAALFGHLEIMEVLGGEAADANIETGAEKGAVAMTGLTAFDLCAKRLKQPPPTILEAGGVAVSAWQRRLHSCMEYMVSVGVKSGSGSSGDTWHTWLASSVPNVNASTYAQANAGARAKNEMSWPLLLPREADAVADTGVEVCLRLPDGTQVLVKRRAAEGLLPLARAQEFGEPSPDFCKWLNAYTHHRRQALAQGQAAWPDGGSGVVAHLADIIRERGPAYEYPEYDMQFSRFRNSKISFVDDVHRPKNRGVIQENEDMLRKMNYIMPDRDGRVSTWSFAGRTREVTLS
ncbi:hypothetical protein LTR95_016171 [Oleoguttula sp. CCFEE 5521]